MQGKYIILYIPLVFDHQYLVDRDEIRRSVLLNIQHEPHGIPWKNLCAQFSFDKHVCALEYPLMPSAPNIALAPTGRGQDRKSLPKLRLCLNCQSHLKLRHRFSLNFGKRSC